MRLEMNLTGLDEFRDEVEGMSQRAQQLEKPLRVRAQALNALIIETFERSAGPNGEKWAPLSEATKQRKGSSKPLIDTGLLRNSINVQAAKDAIRFGVTGQRARVGQAHQFGTEDIPRRPFLPLDESGEPSFVRGAAKRWWDRTLKMLQTYLTTGKLR